MAKPTRLQNLKLERIDLVDDPANPGSRVLLYKRGTAKENPEGVNQYSGGGGLGRATGEGPKAQAARDRAQASARNEKWRQIGRLHDAGRHSEARAMEHEMRAGKSAKENQVTDKKKPNLLKRLLAHLAKEAEAVDPDALREWAEGEAEEPEHVDASAEALKSFHEKLGKAIEAFGDGAGLPSEHPAHALKALHKEIGDHLGTMTKEAEARKEAEAAAKARKEAEGEEMGPGITKRFTDLEKRAIAAEKRAEDAEKIAKTAREERAVDLEKANLAKFKGLGVNPDTDAALMVALEASNPAVAKRMREILSGAEAMVTKNDLLLQELGTPRGGATGGTAWAEIEAEAEKLVQKDNKLTKEGAINRVMDKRPDLVKRYNAEEASRA